MKGKGVKRKLVGIHPGIPPKKKDGRGRPRKDRSAEALQTSQLTAAPAVVWFALSCVQTLKLLNLHSHDLRVPVGSLSRFKLSLPQCNVHGVLNCMSAKTLYIYKTFQSLSF